MAKTDKNTIQKLKLKVDKGKGMRANSSEPNSTQNNNLGDNLYFSGFCLTDNKNFSEFYIKKIPDLKKQYKTFDFSEKDMIYSLEEEVKKENIENKVSDTHFNYFTKKYKNIKFYLLKSFLNIPTFDSVGIVRNDKLVGILKFKGEQNG